MKSLFKKSWFQILVFGILTGAILIIADNKYDLFKSAKKESGTFKGPVEMDKKDMYMTSIKLNETEYDFGKVKEGDTVSHVFKVTNTGDQPLYLFKISGGSCDCIGTSFSKEVVPPGAVNDITVYFNTKGRKGTQARKIVVTANTEPSETVLNIKAEVE